MRFFAQIRSLAMVLTALLMVSACVSAEERADKHFQSGLSLLESGDVDRAIVEFRNVFQFQATHLEAAAEGLSNDPIVQYNLAEIYAGLDRTEDALRQFRKTVQIAGPTDQREQIVRARAESVGLQSLMEN